MTTTTQNQPAGYLTGDSPAEARIPVYRTPKGKLTLDPPKPPKAPKPKAKPATGFKPGDRVRRTKPFLGFAPRHEITQGEVYTIAKVKNAHAITLEGKDPTFGYAPESFELVTEPEPTPPTREEIEAAAEAMYDAVVFKGAWDRQDYKVQERYRGYARAALLAARAVAK